MSDGCLPRGPIFGNIVDVCNALESDDPNLNALRTTVHQTLGEQPMPNA